MSSIQQPQSPISQSPPSTAFWGPLLSPSGTASPVLHRFLNALFIHHDCSSLPANTHSLDCFKIAAGEEAMGVPPAENPYLVIVNSLKSHAATHSDVDSAIHILYHTCQIPHVMSTRCIEPLVWNGMPVVPYQGFVEMQVRRLSREPRRYWEGMNGALAAGLVDPETGVEFAVKVVPWECFPQEPMYEVVQRETEMAELFASEFKTWFSAFLERRRAQEVQAVMLSIQAQSIQAQRISDNSMMEMESMTMMHESQMRAQRSSHEAIMRGLRNSASYI